MIEESSHTESTPLNRAVAQGTFEASASALLADAKLLGSALDMLVGSTHVETSTSAFHVLDHWYLTTTVTSSDTSPRRRNRVRPLQPIEPTVEDQFDRANNERIELLARQYVMKDKSSSEEQARLAIVTERVRRLLPPVTSEEFEALERNLEASHEVSALLDGLRARLAWIAGKHG